MADRSDGPSHLIDYVHALENKGSYARGEQVLADKVIADKNIEVIFNGATTEIKGKDRVESLVYQITDGASKEIKVDGVFIEIGHLASTKWLSNLDLNLTERGEIKITVDNATNIPGVFAAGDITEITYKQAVISAGEGCKAALQSYRYLQGDKPLAPDWTAKK